MKKLLTLKTWQLCLVMCSVLLFSFSKILLFILAVIISLGWYYTLGTNLYRKLPQMNKMNIKLFKFNLFFTAIYSIISLFYFILVLNLNPLSHSGIAFKFFDIILMAHYVITPFAIFYVGFSIFYTFYFISKSLVSVEKGEIVNVNKYIGEFFMFCYLIIGIWWLQPRIRKIFIEEKTTSDIGN